jgi:hypothetical protein
MGNAGRAALQSGESLREESLISPNGAYALQHRTEGTLALRDNRAARDVWQISAPVSAPGWLTLVPEGFLVLAEASGTLVWSSGGVDRRVVSAMVRNDGRLVLVDPDGNVRWSRDPLSAEDLAAYRPASGDRLQRGEVLADSIVSPDDRYTLTHSSEGETLLYKMSQDGGPRRVWARRAGERGAAISLGLDGVIRAGTDSTVLQRWTGRYLLDPMSFVVSAVVVRNEGDVALLSENGNEIYDSGTAAEESSIAKIERAEALREVKQAGKMARPDPGGNTNDATIEFPDEESLLIRTDFSDDEAWRLVCAPDTDGCQDFGLVDDRKFGGVTLDVLLSLVDRCYFFVADGRTIADPEHPILVVNNDDPFDDDDPEFAVQRGATFRVTPSHKREIAQNLSIANMDFADFAQSADDDGVFRGFR